MRTAAAHAAAMHTHPQPTRCRSLAFAGSLAITAIAAFAGPSAAHAAAPNDSCGQSVFVDAYSWTPHLTSDDSGGDSVSGTGYSIDFQWNIDWESLTGTVDAQVTSGDYSLIGANVWYTIPAPEFEGDTNEGGLPETEGFDHTLSSSSSYVFDDPEITSLYAIQLVIAQCGDSVPTTDPVTTDPAAPTTVVSGSGGSLPSTGSGPTRIVFAAVAAVAGVLLVRMARRSARIS